MSTISAYDKAKMEESAAKAAKRLETKRKRAHKRQEATMEVVKLTIQKLLASQTPPLKYFDESHDMVPREFKPNSPACKKFMQVSVCMCIMCMCVIVFMNVFTCVCSQWKQTSLMC